MDKKDNMVKVSMLLPVDLFRDIKYFQETTGCTMSWLVRKSVRRYLTLKNERGVM